MKTLLFAICLIISSACFAAHSGHGHGGRGGGHGGGYGGGHHHGVYGGSSVFINNGYYDDGYGYYDSGYYRHHRSGVSIGIGF